MSASFEGSMTYEYAPDAAETFERLFGPPTRTWVAVDGEPIGYFDPTTVEQTESGFTAEFVPVPQLWQHEGDQA
jgi:hypothetical protein